MKRSVWDQPCRSWYKNANGTVTAVWTGSVPHYLELLAQPRFEDFDWKYVFPQNRWSFLGNGFSQRETLGADLAWYIRQRDDSVPLGKKDRFSFPATDEQSLKSGTETAKEAALVAAPVNPPVEPRL